MKIQQSGFAALGNVADVQVLRPTSKVCLWIEQETVHLKAFDGTDPVELNETEVVALIEALQTLLQELK